jgi:hypothetical protein
MADMATADEAGRIMALEAALEDAKRSLIAHDFLLRGLLTHLALSEPRAFEGLVGGLTRSGLYGSHAAAGELTRDVAWELTSMLEDIAASLDRRR